jgi:hypothetical protein
MFVQRPGGLSQRGFGRSLLLLVAASFTLAGCDVFETFNPILKLEVDGFVELSADGDTVLHTLSVRNPTGRDVTLTDSSCNGGLRLEVRTVPSEGGVLVWDSGDVLRNICTPSIWPLPARGGTVSGIITRLPVPRILGDSIPPGRYELRIRPNFDQRVPVPEHRLVPVELLLGG